MEIHTWSRFYLSVNVRDACSCLVHVRRIHRTDGCRTNSESDLQFSCHFSPQGHPPLVRSLAKFFSRIVGHEIDPLEDVLVTVGAYQALFCAFQVLVNEGDEV